MTATVLGNSSFMSESFAVETDMKQGCIIASCNLSLLLPCFTSLAKPYSRELWSRRELTVGYAKHTRFKAKTEFRNTTITELQYADDKIISANSAEELSGTLDTFAKAYRAFGLAGARSTSTQPAVFYTYRKNGQHSEKVDHFLYLNSLLFSSPKQTLTLRSTVIWPVPKKH